MSEYNKLSTSSDSWYCNPCTLPNFTDSFFDLDLSEESNTPNHDYVPSSSEETSGVNKNNCTRFKELRDATRLHPRNCITAYLNVNSIRYKFDEIRELLTDRIVDLLFIAEAKLDATFNDNLFSVDGCKLHRRDRNSNGGGILCMISSDVPSSRKVNFECDTLENISCEIHINNTKWLIIAWVFINRLQ